MPLVSASLTHLGFPTDTSTWDSWLSSNHNFLHLPHLSKRHHHTPISRGKTSARLLWDCPLFHMSVDFYRHTYNDPFRLPTWPCSFTAELAQLPPLPTPVHSAHLSELLKFKSNLFFSYIKRLNDFQRHCVYDLKFHSARSPDYFTTLWWGSSFHSFCFSWDWGNSDFTPATSQPWSP